jgi:hypothetical protein
VLRGYLRNLRLRGFVLPLCLLLRASMALGQLSTEDHLAEPGFWPTQDHASREGFVGSDACVPCHAVKVASQKDTPMARTAMPAGVAEILHSHPVLTFDVDKFKYKIDTNAKRSMYSISDGDLKLSHPLTWAFGTGRVAQSYLFKKDDGSFNEARVTYFTNLGKLEFTPARSLLSPKSAEEAMSRPVGQSEVQRCFACHSTASNIGRHFDEEHLIPGVTCEACHGPGATHVKTMDDSASSKSASAKPSIFNSAHLSPADAVDFCGACHGSWWDVKLAGVKGVSTTRSAPFRLVTSKCWGKGDARLTCTACHDPHKQLETSSMAYDAKCLSCHVNAPGAKRTDSHPGASCPKAAKNCTSCHMPKINVPEMHADFTDHRIRIVQPGEAFPE